MKSLRRWNREMPFNHLLFESLLPGITKAEDRKSGCHSSANLDHRPGATVLLFHLDDLMTRKRLGLIEDKCCDYLYFLKHKNRTSLIFVELKSTNVQGAKQQILNAHYAIRDKVSHVKSRSSRVLAVIVSSLGTPENAKGVQKEMKAEGIELYFGRSRGNSCCSINELVKDLM
jgi:hypothetical protein